MTQANEETSMYHFACGVCSMTATCVRTPTALLAWLDHMESHAQKTLYDCWTWTVVPLSFD